MLDYGLEARPLKPRKRKKENRMFMIVRALVLGAVLIVAGNYFAGNYMVQEEARAACALINKGRCEEGVAILERLLKEKKLTNEFDQTLNDAYVQMALSYAKAGQYPRAVELLKKVEAKSNAYSQAQQLLRRYSWRVR